KWIIEGYTREAGVRNLERSIGAVCRSIAAEIVGGKTDKVTVDREYVSKVLGPRRFEPELASRTSVPGVATGMAYTPVGGEILFIEATRMPGKGAITLTGQIGDVMKESATAAFSLLRSRATAMGIDAQRLADSDIHIHVAETVDDVLEVALGGVKRSDRPARPEPEKKSDVRAQRSGKKEKDHAPPRKRAASASTPGR